MTYPARAAQKRCYRDLVPPVLGKINIKLMRLVPAQNSLAICDLHSRFWRTSLRSALRSFLASGSPYPERYGLFRRMEVLYSPVSPSCTCPKPCSVIKQTNTALCTSPVDQRRYNIHGLQRHPDARPDEVQSACTSFRSQRFRDR